MDKLDGLVGWLTLFGYAATESGAEAALEEVLRKVKGIVKKEMVTVLRRSNHYRPILKALSQGKNGWSQLKKELINQTGRFITDAQVSRALTTLVNLSLVEHNQNGYTIPPILAEVVAEL